MKIKIELKKYKVNKGSSYKAKILSASIIIAFMTMFVKILSFIKDLVVASTFGTSDLIDAFFISFTIPTFVTGIITGAFNAAFIPTYIQVEKECGEQESKKLFTNIVTATIVILSIATILLFFGGPYLINLMSSGFNSNKLELTISLFNMQLPTILMTGLTTIWSSLMNARGRFAITSFLPVFIPVSILFGLLFVGKLGVYTLTTGIVLGNFIQLIVMAILLAKNHYPMNLKYYKNVSGTKEVLKQYIPMIGASSIMGTTVLVDQGMAAQLDSGSVSSLNYGMKIVTLITSVGATALGTAALPYFSSMVSLKKWDEIRSTINYYSKLILLLGIPIVIFICVFSGEIIRLIFERGSFTAEDTNKVSLIQSLYAIQIPFFMLGILTVRVISSLKGNYVMFWGNIINVLLNVLLNFLLIKVLGTAGIALSTSVVYLVSWVYLQYMLKKLLRRAEEY